MACDNCKKCIHACKAASYDDYTSYYDEDDLKDWFCKHKTFNVPKLIEEYVSETYEPSLMPPSWCPEKRTSSTDTSTPKRVRRTYTEQQAALRNAEGPSTWDSIQAGKIYHCPPIGREKRCDLLVISKTNYMMTCKELNYNNPTVGVIRTFYKTDTEQIYKFFVEHRLIKIESMFDIEALKQGYQSSRSYHPSI